MIVLPCSIIPHAAVCSIASNPNCTVAELRSFTMGLRNLMWLCKCDVNLSLDGESPSLLHRY